MRSRAMSLPALCSRSRRSGPPPASASSEMRRSSSVRSRCLPSGIKPRSGSDNWSSLGRRSLGGKNANGEMCGNPSSSEEQHHAKQQFRAHSGGALERRFERRHVFRSLHKNEHSPQGQRHDKDGGHNGSENHLHAIGLGPPRSGMEKDSATRGNAARRRQPVSGKAISASTSKFSVNPTNHPRQGWNRWDSP